MDTTLDSLKVFSVNFNVTHNFFLRRRKDYKSFQSSLTKYLIFVDRLCFSIFQMSRRFAM